MYTYVFFIYFFLADTHTYINALGRGSEKIKK